MTAVNSITFVAGWILLITSILCFLLRTVSIPKDFICLLLQESDTWIACSKPVRDTNIRL